MDFSLSNVKDLVSILTSLVLPAILYVLSQIRGHLKRIEKIEQDVNVAHKRIRRLAKGRIDFDEDDEDEFSECDHEECPLLDRDEPR